ncbi:MAG: non-ribosomal peptide synthetase, partial [Burkholderiales bacterium]
MTPTDPPRWPDDIEAPRHAVQAADLPATTALPVASHAQEALWFIDRLRGPSDLYHVTHALRLSGALDVDALECSLAALVERHPCLRTGFQEYDGKLLQVVRAAVPVRLERLDAAGVTAVERERSLHALLQAGTKEPFDLTRPPLFRGRLIRVADDEHVLLLVAHHVVTDGWSMGIIAREIATLYAGFAAGRQPSLPAVEARFVEFAKAQRERTESAAGAKDLAYWRGQLADLEPLELPCDAGASEQAPRSGRMHYATVPDRLVQDLKSLARRERATLFMVMLAAYQVLLMRLSGREDFAVGAPVTGRSRTDLEGVVGYFVNSLVVRTDLAGAPRFRELLGRTRQTVLDALAHQQAPFEQLVNELAPERRADRNPLFDVMLNFMDGIRDTFSLPGLRCDEVELPWLQAKFAMTLYAEVRSTAIRLRIACRSDLFSSPRATEM